ncbi:hypothetical protein [Amycolatopsis sp. lyj-112]|uniref:hypothetical protein n=1 Tax=Amycolatopsis sp. lyj-112 TaxID=2789288 RepID=UPI00397B2E01
MQVNASLSPGRVPLRVGLYRALRRQGSSDVKARVRDTLGISNAQFPVAQIETLDKFFKARNAIVHDVDYEDPSAPSSRARWRRKMEEVRDDCDAVLAVVATIIRATTTNVRACR